VAAGILPLWSCLWWMPPNRSRRRPRCRKHMSAQEQIAVESSPVDVRRRRVESSRTPRSTATSALGVRSPASRHSAHGHKPTLCPTLTAMPGAERRMNRCRSARLLHGGVSLSGR
jgi:hypothetical protein